MLTLIHAPRSRGTRVRVLLEEMGVADVVDLRIVDIRRQDGTGARDAGNPHPEGKVPALLDEWGDVVTETGAVMLMLTDMFPEGGMGPLPGDRDRGAYLTWLFWYGSVMEPVMIQKAAGLAHPWLAATYRGMEEMEARISAALARGPWLLGEKFSAADILIQSPWRWFREMEAGDPAICDWVARGAERAAFRKVMAAEKM